MNLRNFVLTMVCGLAYCAVAQAQTPPCRMSFAAGTYVMSIKGHVTMAPPPTLVVAPFVGLVTVKIDQNGTLETVSPMNVIIAGQKENMNALTPSSRISIESDCTASFRVLCVDGCEWEGAGFFFSKTREFQFIFTKANGYPITATVDMKQAN